MISTNMNINISTNIASWCDAVRTHSQNMTSAASAQAEMKMSAHLSYRVAILRPS